jgi:hypothetical protein
MTTTTTTLAVGGTTPKINETVTSLRAAATVMALPNISSAPPPARCWLPPRPALGRYHSREEGCG